MLDWLWAWNVQWFGLPVLAFSVWMALDAYRRSAEMFWIWVILILPPIGGLVYFFAVWLPSFRLPRPSLGRTGSWKRVSLDELRYRVQRTPTVMNQMALAERLKQKGLASEAIPHLESALAKDETYCPAMHLLAECHLECGESEKALIVITALLKRDPHWSNYLAWRTLIEAQDAAHMPEQALESCRELERRQPTWENRCRLAERLIDLAHGEEAVQLLENALEEHSYAPLQKRLANFLWARRARRLLREADQLVDGKQ